MTDTPADARSIRSAVLGFPRIGARRELKFATEKLWRGEIDAETLDETAAQLRTRHWIAQRQRGIDVIPSNDFSLYDQVLDMTVLLGAIPQRYGWQQGTPVDHATYFACARGTDTAPAMEMTKWFDTNYHYLVPEFDPETQFILARTTPLDHWQEAQQLGVTTRPVLIGPITYLLLGKSKTPGLEPLSLLPKLLPVYAELLALLKRAGVTDVQIDEPVLVTDLPDGAADAFRAAYDVLTRDAPQIMLTTYFGALGDNLDLALDLPVAGLHLDAVRGGTEIDKAAARISADRTLSLGLIDGRNIWRANLPEALTRARDIAATHAGDIQIATSCSLLHVPVDASLESRLDAELKTWLAFATQKLDEVASLALGLRDGDAAIEGPLRVSDGAARARARSKHTYNPLVRGRLASLHEGLGRRTPGRIRYPPGRPGGYRPAAPADHDHRLLPADQRGPQGPRRPQARRHDGRGL